MESPFCEPGPPFNPGGDPPDSDGDGVVDSSDSCPSVSGPASNSESPLSSGGDGGTSGSTTDTTAPGGTLIPPKSQKVDGTLELDVTCDEACTASASGTLSVPSTTSTGRSAQKVLKFKLPTSTLSLGPGETATLKLKVPRKAKLASIKALRSGKRVKAEVAVTLVDAAGNSVIQELVLKLR